jgi:hypothetical protein
MVPPRTAAALVEPGEFHDAAALRANFGAIVMRRIVRNRMSRSMEGLPCFT